MRFKMLKENEDTFGVTSFKEAWLNQNGTQYITDQACFMPNSMNPSDLFYFF